MLVNYNKRLFSTVATTSNVVAATTAMGGKATKDMFPGLFGAIEEKKKSCTVANIHLSCIYFNQ